MSSEEAISSQEEQFLDRELDRAEAERTDVPHGTPGHMVLRTDNLVRNMASELWPIMSPSPSLRER